MLSLKFPIANDDASDFTLIAQECVHQSASNIMHKQLQVVIDVDSQLPSSFELGWLKQAMQKMLKLAIDRSPYRSEIELTACRVGDAVEFEVADSGDTPLEDSLAFRHSSSFSFSPIARELLASVQARGAEFWGTSCPQGGMAWTLRMPFRAAMAKAA
jgi:hypothetical protein